MVRAVALATGLAVSAAVTACGGGASSQPTSLGAATVVAIVDGDTIDVEVGGRDERVRLLGIDTPESVDPDRPVECFGPEASARTAELVPVGATVTLERDVEGRDRFGRLLAYVFRADAPDGTPSVNEVLLAEGFAEVLLIEPNGAYAERFTAAEAAARAAGAGLWGSCPDAGR